MSFGCSVGDIITVLQLANKIRERFVDAPEQFKAISDESVTAMATYGMLIFDPLGSGASQLSLTISRFSYRSGISPASRERSWLPLLWDALMF
jgi:hypothetical protein